MSTEGNRFEPAAAQNLLALFEFSEWSRIRETLGVLQKDMKAALRVAVRKTGQWANREGAKGLAKETGIPLRTLKAGLRLKFQYQSVKGFATARLWYGLNAISLKYIGARQTKRGVRARGTPVTRGGFVSPTLGGHAFRRVSGARLPLERLEKPIAQKGEAYLAQFEGEVAAKFVEFFFSALDAATGRSEGESMAIAGNISITRR